MPSVATNTLPGTGSTRPASARRSTVFMKMLMAVSGALFVFYVLAHMYGNLKIFSGVEAFDEYDTCAWRALPGLVRDGDLWVLPERRTRVALEFSLVAR